MKNILGGAAVLKRKNFGRLRIMKSIFSGEKDLPD